MGPKTTKDAAKAAGAALAIAKPFVKLSGEEGAAWDLVEMVLKRLGK